jgi:diacylglycerol kinase family enzyme
VRALLVFNPNATTTDDRVRDVISSALASEVDLEVHATKQRGHATHIVAGAVHEGVDVVFALGGDGTANEVIQALAGTRVVLGVIPGGGANVLARALGLPNESVPATGVLLDHLRNDRTRRISLGRAAGRYFGFNAGFGFDAAVVLATEQNVRMKRLLRQGAFVSLGLREWFTGADRRDPAMHVQLPGGDPRGPYMVTMIGNTDPYTFLGERAFRVTPDATFEAGLDLLAVHPVRTAGILRILVGAFAEGRHVRNRNCDYWRDLSGFTLTATRPQPLMVDGDYAGEHTAVTFEHVPDALTVLAASPSATGPGDAADAGTGGSGG